MSTPQFSAHTLATNIEPIIADAVERGNVAALAIVRDYATLFTEAELELYHPENIFQTFVAHFPPSSFSIHVDHVKTERVGDPVRMAACVGALVKGIERGPNTTLAVSIYEAEEHGDMIPRMSIAFQGPGRVPDQFLYGTYFPMTLEALSDCWTLATSGGRIDRTENGVELRLNGMRMPPPPLELATEIAAHIGPMPDQAGAERALALLEDSKPPAMNDLERLYVECLANHEHALNQAGVAHSYSFSEGFPQLPLNRTRMQGFFVALFDWAIAVMPDGGTLETLVEYDPETREANAMIGLSAATGVIRETYHTSLLRRAIRFHQGEFELDVTDAEAAITVTLADSIGQTLDRWIPHWDAFGVESRKYLRLLKSGAQAPPEDFILGGILEQELENWLLPRLSDPAVVAMANEGNFRNDGIQGSIKERLKKALEQVGRGKPKKEICQPQYAGELFAAFGKDLRHRSALGTHLLTNEELQALCEGLLAKPVDLRACLVNLAAILHRSG